MTLTTLIALGMPSAAAQQPVPATLTQLAYDGSTLAGVLTVRAISGDVAVDPSSLTVEVAGTSTPASIDSASAMRRAVFLVVDTSGSMTSNAGIPMIKAAVSDFLDRVPADVEVGLVSFSNVAAVDIAPTTDRAAVRSAAGSLEARGETALFDAVALAVDGLGTVGERSILLLSDGVNTAGRRDLGPVLTALQQAGVRLDSIGLRTRVTADDVLKQLASAGGGSFAAATDAAAVTGAFSASATALERQVTWRAPIGAVPIGDLPIQVQGRAGGLPFVAAGTVTVASALTALPTATAAMSSMPAIAAAVPPATVPRWL
ncbi:MAG: vWA domain-containing protein, partial [Candidatus Phosphoribacter sp.]